MMLVELNGVRVGLGVLDVVRVGAADPDCETVAGAVPDALTLAVEDTVCKAVLVGVPDDPSVAVGVALTERVAVAWAVAVGLWLLDPVAVSETREGVAEGVCEELAEFHAGGSTDAALLQSLAFQSQL